jgi:signal peptidase I
MDTSARDRAGFFWREWVRPLLVVGLVLGSFRSAVADWNDVPTGSMKPTILEGDRIFVDRTAYDFRVPFAGWRIHRRAEPSRGDIVVFWSPVDGRRLVKRVIGVPGDVVVVRSGRVVVNGVEARYEPMLSEARGRLGVSDFDPRSVALETLAGRTHPVMATSGWPAGFPFGPDLVPTGRYFVMGDHRDDSYDSRFWGYVDRDRIVGRARAVVGSLDPQHHWRPRWQRFFTGLS